MNIQPGQARLPLRGPADLLAAVPRLLGFTPDASLVVLGLTLPAGRVQVAMRYDLPDPPDANLTADIAEHAISVLTSQHMTGVALVGYGPGPAVTPVVDAIRAAAARARITLREALRVEGGRYWSYLCTSPSCCCGPDGEPFDTRAHPVSQAMASRGMPALPDRAALAATIAPPCGPLARTMLRATRLAEQTAIRLIHRDGPDALRQRGLTAVQHAISTYRAGGALTPDARHAWLALVLLQLPVRDDAWARMDPGHRDAHVRLWSDVVRRAQPGYIAAPASLLAWTAWQAGEGALANIALDRAFADDSEYSLARLIHSAVEGGLPPSMAIAPMTPEEVAASYANRGDGDAPAPAST
jgi:hypothetical protein